MKRRPTNSEVRERRERDRAEWARFSVIERIQDEGEDAIIAELRLYRRGRITMAELHRRVWVLTGRILARLKRVWPEAWEVPA